MRESGDLGLAAEQLLTATAASRPAVVTVTEAVNTLRQIANAEGPGSLGRKLELLASLLGRATPLEARYLLRLVTKGLRLGIGTPTILDALAQVHIERPPDKVLAFYSLMPLLYGADDTPASAYACPMHPEVTAAEPGTCPSAG